MERDDGDDLRRRNHIKKMRIIPRLNYIQHRGSARYNNIGLLEEKKQNTHYTAEQILIMLTIKIKQKRLGKNDPVVDLEYS